MHRRIHYIYIRSSLPVEIRWFLRIIILIKHWRIKIYMALYCFNECSYMYRRSSKNNYLGKSFLWHFGCLNYFFPISKSKHHLQVGYQVEYMYIKLPRFINDNKHFFICSMKVTFYIECHMINKAIHIKTSSIALYNSSDLQLSIISVNTECNTGFNRKWLWVSRVLMSGYYTRQNYNLYLWIVVRYSKNKQWIDLISRSKYM